MIWKQPIPTNLKDLTKGNLFAATVFAELIRRGANSDTEIILEGNWLNVSRGQCICGRFELAKCFGLKENESGRIQRILNKLEKTYKLIDKRKSLNCTIVTIKNYDELICFDQSNKSDATNRRPIDNQSTDTNKSVKNEESVERDINPTNNFPPCDDQELYKVAHDLKLPLDYVKNKHALIQEMVGSGEMRERYPKNKKTLTTLRSWLRGDIAKGIAQELDEMGMLILEAQNPNSPKSIEIEDKKKQMRKEGQL